MTERTTFHLASTEHASGTMCRVYLPEYGDVIVQADDADPTTIKEQGGVMCVTCLWKDICRMMVEARREQSDD